MALTDNGNGLSAADVAAVVGNGKVARLEDMIDEAKTDHERQMVSDWINRLQGN